MDRELTKVAVEPAQARIAGVALISPQPIKEAPKAKQSTVFSVENSENSPALGFAGFVWESSWRSSGSCSCLRGSTARAVVAMRTVIAVEKRIFFSESSLFLERMEG